MRDHDPNERPTEPPPVDRVLLTRFVAGEVSPAEAAAVERWLADDPARGAALAELRRIWSRAAALPSEARVESLWHDLRRRMDEDADEKPVRRERPTLELRQPRSTAKRQLVAGLAAAGIAAAAVGVGLSVARTRTAPTAVSPQPAERVYSTARGQRGVVELADGSRVELGVDSRIRVRLHDAGRREVHLEGEAVFEVVHDERRPFLVYAGGAVTEDLGTRFGVRAYAGDGAVQVVVVSGKVALRPARPRAPADTADVVLGPRDVGELDLTGETRVWRNVNPDVYLAWTRGRLVFRQASLAEIAARLERWYDVEIAMADPAMAARRVTLDLDAPSLEEALEALAVPLGLRYERDGRRVEFRR